MFDEKSGRNFSFGKAHWSIQLLILLLIAFFIRTFFYGLYQVPTGSMETTILVGDRFLADKLTSWFKKPKRGDIIAFNDPLYDYSDNYFVNLFQRYVYGPSNWTKRVIGIPGDQVQGRIENGVPVVYLNGKKLNEPYLNKYPLINLWHVNSGLTSTSMDYQRRDVRSFDSNVNFDEQPFYKINPKKVVRMNGLPVLIYPQTPLPGNKDVFDVILEKNEYWVMGDNRLGSWDSRSWGKLDGDLIHGKIIFRLWSLDSSDDWWVVDLIKHPIDFFKRIRWSRCLEKVK